MRGFLVILILLSACVAEGSELTHSFKSPSFSGQGYSAHVMTIENQ